MDNRCIVCEKFIPEGRNVCQNCEKWHGVKTDCKFIGKTGWCELYFHEPKELERMCPICADYEQKSG